MSDMFLNLGKKFHAAAGVVKYILYTTVYTERTSKLLTNANKIYIHNANSAVKIYLVGKTLNKIILRNLWKLTGFVLSCLHHYIAFCESVNNIYTHYIHSVEVYQQVGKTYSDTVYKWSCFNKIIPAKHLEVHGFCIVLSAPLLQVYSTTCFCESIN